MLQNPEVEQMKRFRISEILEYIPHSVVSKTILEKPTGRVVAASFDSAPDQPENISMFDRLIQIIDGNAELVIDSELHLLATGDFIIIPANARSKIKANQRFKMITTVLRPPM
jgi:quercetin dioxygenase-like cupin family protein